jgi:hypothetical protein
MALSCVLIAEEPHLPEPKVVFQQNRPGAAAQADGDGCFATVTVMVSGNSRGPY